MALGKKTGGKVKGSKNKMTMAEAAVKDILTQSNDPLKILLEWIARLADKFNDRTISTEDEKIFAELIKMGLPYTSRKMPVAIEADVKADVNVFLNHGDDKL